MHDDAVLLKEGMCSHDRAALRTSATQMVLHVFRFTTRHGKHSATYAGKCEYVSKCLLFHCVHIGGCIYLALPVAASVRFQTGEGETRCLLPAKSQTPFKLRVQNSMLVSFVIRADSSAYPHLPFRGARTVLYESSARFNSSSTCDLCIDNLLPPSSSFSNTASTSMGGSRPSRWARFQRFSRAIPVQGYRSYQYYGIEINTSVFFMSTYPVLPAHIELTQNLLVCAQVLLMHPQPL
jgi:hypothetical protein